MTWSTYDNFVPAFLERHHDLILYDAFHRIKAYLLFPPGCDCEERGPCLCAERRAEVLLSLNVDLYNKLQLGSLVGVDLASFSSLPSPLRSSSSSHSDSSSALGTGTLGGGIKPSPPPDALYAARILLRIPEESFFRQHYGEVYPLWLIEEELKEREESCFKRVEQLTWTLLRLGRTHEMSITKEPRASLKDALAIIVGTLPLKTKNKRPDLSGEKTYKKEFHTYKSLCHFLGALKHMEPELSLFDQPTPDRIRSFFTLAQGLRQRLLHLETSNAKGKIFLSRDDLLPLPPWVKDDPIEITIPPFEDKLQEINSSAVRYAPGKGRILDDVSDIPPLPSEEDSFWEV